MTLTPLNNLQDAKLDPHLEYKALVRSLKYPQGFGLLFVQCAPAKGEELIAKIRQDLPQKRVEVLSLTAPIETLYDKVDALYRDKPIDILFVRGIEHSLYDYEKNRLWDDDAQRLAYSETGVPHLLQHLNLSRERFQDSFPFCFVFLIPHFALKYFTRRAPDFFDWNSGVFEFLMGQEQLHKEVARATKERSSRNLLLELTQDKCRKNLLDIQALIGESYQTVESRAELFLEQGRLLFLLKEWEAAKVNFDKVLHLNPNHLIALNNRGATLSALGHYEDAIASYKKALQLKSDYLRALYNWGDALSKLGRTEEAIIVYNKALEVNPNDYEVWTSRGEILHNLERYEDAISSYNKALQLKPDFYFALHNRGVALARLGYDEEAVTNYNQAIQIHSYNLDSLDSYLAWNNRGYALLNLSRYEEAIASFDKALQVKYDDDSAWYIRGIALGKLGRYEEAVASYDKALQLKPDDSSAWNNRGIALGNLERYEDALSSFGKALELKPDDDSPWYNHGMALGSLGRYEEAVTSFGKALELNLSNPSIFYNQACVYALQGKRENAMAALDHAVELSPDKYREMAKIDSDFDFI